MTDTLDNVFAPTHKINGVPVMRNPDWTFSLGSAAMWMDETGTFQRLGSGRKAEPISPHALPAATKEAQGGEFGSSYGLEGEVIPTGWWVTHYARNHSEQGVMVTRDAAAAALRACAWPDSSAPCGTGSNSNDDDATLVGKDNDDNCIVRLFVRGKGYFRVKIPRVMFLEIVDE